MTKQWIARSMHAMLAAACAGSVFASSSTASAATGAIPASPTASAFLPVMSDAGDAKNGIVYDQSRPDSLVSGVSLIIPAGLASEDVHVGGLAALTAQIVLRTPVLSNGIQLPLQDALLNMGASITYGIEGQSVHFFIEARNETLAPALALVSEALAGPDFSNATFLAAREDLRTKIAAVSHNGLLVGIFSFRDAFYRRSTAGHPIYGTEATVDALHPADARNFFRDHYRRDGASASVIGMISTEVRTEARALLDTLAGGSSAQTVVTDRPALQPQTRILNYRDITDPWLVLGFTAPEPNSPDFAAMLVLQSLIQSNFVRDSTTTPTVADAPIGARYDYQSDPASFVIT